MGRTSIHLARQAGASLRYLRRGLSHIRIAGPLAVTIELQGRQLLRCVASRYQPITHRPVVTISDSNLNQAGTTWACQHRAVNENTCWFCSDDRLGEGVPRADATAAALRQALAPFAQRLRVHNGVIRIP